ncbi:MAG: hypothetical protein M3124_01625, partial [Actinomycetota bacterium]|nr:hypothetical protein [Actinomycetota bacterium]
VFPLLPMAAVGIGGIAKELSERLSARAVLSLALAWVMAAVGVAVTYSATQRDRGLERQREAVTTMLEQLPPGASIMSMRAGQPLVLSGSTNPTRHQTFLRGGLSRYVDDTWPGGLAAFAEWVGREEPTIISLNRRSLPQWLRKTIGTEYRRVGRGPGWTWYVHRSVGPRVLSTLRSLNRQGRI